VEIDLLGLGRDVAVAVEVKWSDEVDPEEIAEDLVAKVARLDLDNSGNSSQKLYKKSV